jgi:hypothetical protein
VGAGIIGTLALIYLGFTVLFVAAAVSIVRKAGYCGWWVAAGAVPLVNIIMLFAFAFADWPALRERRRAEAASAIGRGHPSFSQSPLSQSPLSQSPNAPLLAVPLSSAPPSAVPLVADDRPFDGSPGQVPPGYAVPDQPAPKPPPPPFPGHHQPNILPGR